MSKTFSKLIRIRKRSASHLAIVALLCGLAVSLSAIGALARPVSPISTQEPPTPTPAPTETAETIDAIDPDENADIPEAQCDGPRLVAAPDFPPFASSERSATPTAAESNASEAVLDGETASHLETLTHELAECLTDGNRVGVANLVSELYLGTVFGGGLRMTRSEYLEIAARAPVVPVRILSFSDPAFSGLRTARADVESVVGNQLRREEWTFIFEVEATASYGTPVAGDIGSQGTWLVHGVRPLTAPAARESSQLEVTFAAGELSVDRRRVAGPNVTISAANNDSAVHEMLVLRFAQTAGPDDLLRAPDDRFPAGIEVIGQTFVPPQSSGTLTLVDLQPGTYTIVCLIPDSNGVPHLSHGEIETFQVQ